MCLNLHVIIICCYWNSTFAIAPAICDPLSRHQSATNLLYFIYCNIRPGSTKFLSPPLNEHIVYF